MGCRISIVLDSRSGSVSLNDSMAQFGLGPSSQKDSSLCHRRIWGWGAHCKPPSALDPEVGGWTSGTSRLEFWGQEVKLCSLKGVMRLFGPLDFKMLFRLLLDLNFQPRDLQGNTHILALSCLPWSHCVSCPWFFSAAFLCLGLLWSTLVHCSWSCLVFWISFLFINSFFSNTCGFYPQFSSVWQTS